MLELFTTVATKKQAQKIAAVFVTQKLAACVSYWQISSVYRWKGKICNTGEWTLCIKTSEKAGKKVEKKLRELHPYEMPVITMQKINVDKKVKKWVSDSTAKG
ncbi:MAG: divalent-cation tolerance protein CutA [Candidatus Micrarchaeota archaeon]|nr:divalent-cation tolerance protein CutA [Candidatus Micrarchaeota archaeon]